MDCLILKKIYLGKETLRSDTVEKLDHRKICFPRQSLSEDDCSVIQETSLSLATIEHLRRE